jgi:oligopeptidase B
LECTLTVQSKTMQNRLLSALLIILLISCNTKTEMKKEPYQWPGITAPVADKKVFVRTIHGDSVTDNYNWMIDFFKKGPDSTKVVDYLKAENTYLDTMMSGTKQLQADLFKEMKARIKEKDESVPSFKNGYYYYTRTEDGQQYYKYCRKKGSLTAPEEILLDVDEMAKGKAYYSATGFEVSDDNKLVAFGVDEVSRRQYNICIKNLETGEVTKDVVKNTSGDPTFASDNKTFFYTSKNLVTLLSEKIKRHTLGTPETQDATVYDEKDKSNYIGVGKTKDGKHILIYSQATLSAEIRFISASAPMAEFKVFSPRMKDVLYDVTPLADKFLILTNWNAKKFQADGMPAG